MNFFENGRLELLKTLESSQKLSSDMDKSSAIILEAMKNGNKILSCGNGGSAADAMHMAEEFSGRYKSNRQALAGISLCSDGPAMTCIANDFGYDAVFSRQVEALGNPGDVLVVFSTSGESPNILNAIQSAKKQNMKTILVSGKTGGRAKAMVDCSVIVPSQTIARIQEVHSLLIHSWLEAVEEWSCQLSEELTSAQR